MDAVLERSWIGRTIKAALTNANNREARPFAPSFLASTHSRYALRDRQ
jgi:hypothetical protein